MYRKQQQAQIDKKRQQQAGELAEAVGSVQWLKFQLDMAHRRPERDRKTNGN